MTTKLRSPDRYYIALGKIVNQMSHLEYTMISCMTILADDANGNIHSIIAGTSANELCAMLRSNCRHWIIDAKLLKKIETLIDKIEKLNIQRNIYVHSMWLFPKNGEFAVRQRFSNRSKKKMDVETPIPDLDAVKKVSKNAKSLRIELGKVFYFEIHLPRRQAQIAARAAAAKPSQDEPLVSYPQIR